MRPLVENASDPQQVEYAQRQVKDNQRAEWQLWDDQLSTYEGRRFVHSLLSRLPGRNEIPGEGAELYRQLGRRSVEIELYRELEKHREFLVQMEQEAIKRERARDRTTAAQRLTENASREPEFSG